MKKLLFFLALPLFTVAQKQPKLIIGIVADQMRYEMLDRYKNDFGPDGFNLLVAEGMRYDSCTFSYIPTYTAPGHATIYTGTTPAIHGITGNDMYIPTMGNTRYCVADEHVEPVGTSDAVAKRSPVLLRVPTIGDSLKMADEKSKVIALSIKDRGAILPGGKKADAAYWMDEEGNMVSSSYYMQELPQWVDSFNIRGYISNTLISTWDYFQNPANYEESLPDDSPFESKRFDDSNTLPYNISQAIRMKGPGILKETPFGNSLLTQFAIWAMREENLGQDNHTDLLAISYSSTDYIGHAYGPQSVEVQDAYLRLDRELAYLIRVLDEVVGRKNYVLFLTSDHGAANTPSDTAFAYVNNQALKAELNRYTKSYFGFPLVKHIGSQQIWLDNEAMQANSISKEMVIDRLRYALLGNEEFQFEAIYTREEVAECETETCWLFKHALNPEIAGDLFYIRPYGRIERSESFGTTHGTGYLYDTHVPLLFFGGNVAAGRSQDVIHVSDIRRLLMQYLPRR